jgi:hypothetical protein
MNTTKQNWLAQNIVSVLAILWTIFTFYILKLVLLKEVKAAENITFLIINTISNIIMIIVGYFFGSSAGSKDKQAFLNQSPTPSNVAPVVVDQANNTSPALGS